MKILICARSWTRLAVAILPVVAAATVIGAADRTEAADLSGYAEPQPVGPVITVCGAPEEVVVLFDEEGHPTTPARTPYFYCVTNTTLLPGEIPPPPEYCCG